MTIDQRAEVLIQALPYIKAYNQKIVVIKYGGNAMINEDLKRAVMGDLLLLTLVGVKVVLVHGGGPEITDLLKRLGKKSEFINGLRVTDREAADIVQMVLAGKVGKGLVGYIQSMGGKAIGLCGMDGHMIEARKLDDVHGYVGEIVNVNTQPILDVLEKGYIPVISTVGCDNEGNPYNINADTAAARIAASLGAESWRALVRACPAASICLRRTAMEALSSSRRSVRCSMRSRRLAASSLREQTSSKEGPYFIFRDASWLMRSSSWKSSRGSQSSSAE